MSKRAPRLWSSHWWPAALRMGVKPVDGDAYFTGAQKNKGYRYYYSETLDKWIIHEPETGNYSVREFSWTDKDTARGFGSLTRYPRHIHVPGASDAVSSKGVRVDSVVGQQTLAQIHAQISTLIGDESKVQVGSAKEIRALYEAQERAASQATVPAAPKPSEVFGSKIRITKDPAPAAPGPSPAERSAAWLKWLLETFEWGDEEVKEITETFWAASEYEPPMKKKKAMVDIPEGIDIEKLKALGIDVLDIED